MKKRRKLKSWVRILLCVLIPVLTFSVIIMSCGKQETTKNNSETTAEEQTALPEKETTIEETTEPEETTEEFTTQDYDALIDYDADYPFFIKVNRDEHFATVYGMDYEGKYSIPYKVFVCSTAKEPEDTPLGTFEISEKLRWNYMVDGTYTQYAIRIYGQIMLHSIPYKYMSKDSMLYKEYNKLGTAASHGCVRFQVKDVKWIFENCPEGTNVEIYCDPNEKPELPLETIEKISKKDSRKGWDPTDSDKRNPWKDEE